MKYILILFFSIQAQALVQPAKKMGSKSTAQSSTPSMPQALSQPKVQVRGQFVKADKDFIYLKKYDTKKQVKVPKKYSLNSPANIPKNFNLSFSVPFNEFYQANRLELSKAIIKK